MAVVRRPLAPEHQRETADFLKHLFERADDDAFIERRVLRPHGGVEGSLFIPVRDARRNNWAIHYPDHFDGRVNVFVGVLPRYKINGVLAGKGQNTRVGYVAWVDCDKGIPSPWPAGLPLPTMIVETSPGKAHLYWRLSEPTEDLARFESLNRRLARALNGDTVAYDRARILRIPGFLNVKSDYGPTFPRAKYVTR